MLDGYGAPASLLKDRVLLESILFKIPTEMGMHSICEPVLVEVGEKNSKDPGGFSGFVMIAESHISFHTFPNRGFVTIDVYTCQDDLDTNTLTEKFTTLFQLQDVDESVLNRGTKYPIVDIY